MPSTSPRDRARLAELARRYRLWSPEDEPVVLARGTENTTFAVGEYIVRRSVDLDAVTREVELLAALARESSVRVPVPEIHERELGVFAYRRLPGEPLIHRLERERARVQPALVVVLAALRDLPCAERLPIDPYPNEEWHEDAVQAFRSVRAHLRDDRARLVEAFLEEPPPTPRAVVRAQHNDLGAEHILVDAAGDVTGVIDWTDAALTDPVRDIGSLYRDLGPEVALGVGEALDGRASTDEVRRIRFHACCRWLEDVAFGLGDPRTRAPYLDNARRTFEHTFRAV